LNETAERLMDLAQAHIRHRGYGGFSFRELAAEIGIKSASVHHHFPTKATMAAAVAGDTETGFWQPSRRSQTRASKMPLPRTARRFERRSIETDGCAFAVCWGPKRVAREGSTGRP
jgi:TetR/AcrR family transcriptional repressor of nem operon